MRVPPASRPEPPAPVAGKTCLVLSVGGSKGLAHIGAIEAVKADGVTIDCVFGNSMGSLVGGLYASDPKADLAERYRGLLEYYERTTRSEAGFAAILGALGSYLLGGDGLLGAGLGLASTKRLSLERFESSFSAYSRHVAVDDLPLPFATSYQRVQGDGLLLVTPRRGTLASAVSASIANPFVFSDVDVTRGPLDPGGDRVAAVPVEDAFAAFRPARLIVINVTGEPALYSKRVTAVVDEVMVDDCVPPAEPAMRGVGPEFEAARRTGFSQTKDALARYRAGNRALRGYLGAVISENARGAEVVSVAAGSPAERAGLAPKDVIEAVDGAPIACTRNVTHVFGARAPGTSVTLRVRRGEAVEERQVVAGSHPVQLLR